MRAAGFVLVGGQSSRMGRDKAMLPWGFEPLVQHVARVVSQVVGKAFLVGACQRYTSLHFPCLPDLRPPYCGPLAGIEAALESKRAELNLILPCDTSFIQLDELQALLQEARQTAAPCIISRDNTGRFHPLHAVYKSECLPVVQRALNERRFGLMDLMSELEPAVFHIGHTIHNFNTPEEWQKAQPSC